MSAARSLATLPALLLLGLALAACGGDDESGGEGQPEQRTITDPADAFDGGGAGGYGGGGSQGGNPSVEPISEDEVRSAIEQFATSGDPEIVCGAVVTERFLQRAYGDRAGCAAAQDPNAIADAVEVRDVRISGSSAEAMAVPEGGVTDGLEIDVELVREGGAVLIDRYDADVAPGP